MILIFCISHWIQTEGCGKVDQFWRAIPTVGRPIYSSSEVAISRINRKGVVKRLKRISDSPTDPNAKGSEEVEVVRNSICHQSSASPSQPSSRRFQTQVIPSTHRNFQPVLSIIPSSISPPSPNPSTSRPSLVSPVRTSPIPLPRSSLMITSQQLQPVSRSIRRKEDQSPLPFPAACQPLTQNQSTSMTAKYHKSMV
ncbi:hypothetical protein O181_012560 [Austropuccinia psidii MF-1]|uniref:Uncharacterized protein n=1 Tax=Austropuccinia psidii MF-1 TaxID=1389203 RepID=A0A9Q3BY80_9BASI|nr:hypothetical protein [Austropuccinia psidii MF-1]